MLNFPKWLAKPEDIDQESKHQSTLHDNTTLKSQNRQLPTYLCAGIKKLRKKRQKNRGQEEERSQVHRLRVPKQSGPRPSKSRSINIACVIGTHRRLRVRLCQWAYIESDKQGPPAYAKDLKVAKWLRVEAIEKEDQGCCTMRDWSTLKTITLRNWNYCMSLRCLASPEHII